jgi:hypothetical protein
MFIREVGNFSLQKHFGTSIGVLSLATVHAADRKHRLWLLAREMAKLWIVSACDSFGHADWVVKKRSVPLRQAEHAAATGIIDAISRYELPVRKSERHGVLSAVGGK